MHDFIPHQLQHGLPPRPSFRPPFGEMRRQPAPPGLHGPPRPPPPMMMRDPMRHPYPPMKMMMGDGGFDMGVPYPGFAGPVPRHMLDAMAQSDSNFGNDMNNSLLQLPSSLSSSSIVSVAPTMYAAPPVKSLSGDRKYESSIRMLQTNTSSSVAISQPQKSDRYQITKSSFTEKQQNTLFSNGGNDSSTTKKKKRKVVRMAGGQVWEDNTLHEWDSDDFRVFCGDLGNDVTDEVLTGAFSKYDSFVKAKVVRDKRTNKTKGFGFISFKDSQDYIKAMREMNGKYVGSRPLKLKKSTWKERNVKKVRKM